MHYDESYHRSNCTGLEFDSLQLDNGKIRSYFPLPDNYISTGKYHPKLMMIQLLFYAFTKWSSLSLIITCLIVLFLPNFSPFSVVMYFVELILLLVLIIGKQVYFQKVRNQTDSSINSRKVKVYRGEVQYPQLSWGQLQRGDIVYLVQGQAVPADILLLDSQQIQHRQAITYIDTKMIDGKQVALKKNACYSTQMLNRGVMQKRLWQNYRKILTGKLNFKKSDHKYEDFKGYLKLTKDPKIEKLSINNILLRESKIKTSLWVYGLVVYAGMETKIMRNQQNNINLSIFFLTLQDKIFLIGFICNIFFGVIFSVLYTIDMVLSNSYLQILSYHLMMFSLFLPQMLYIAQNLFILYFALTQKIKQVNIRNYQQLQKLSSIDCAVIVNNRVINSDMLIIDQIVTKSSIYELKGEQFGQNSIIISKQRRNGSNISNILQYPSNINNGQKINHGIPRRQQRSKVLPFLNIINNNDIRFDDPNKIKQSEKFEIDDFTSPQLLDSDDVKKQQKVRNPLQPLKLNRRQLYNSIKDGQYQIKQVILSFVLCHQLQFYYNIQKNNYNGISCINTESIVLKLANWVDWQIQPRIDSCYNYSGLLIKQSKQYYNNISKTLSYKNEFITYNWIGINNFINKNDKIFSVVVQCNGKIHLYCKGKPKDIFQRLIVDKNVQKIMDNYYSISQQSKIQSIIYAKRQLTFKQKQIYQNQYNNLKYSLTLTEQQINQFSLKYENNLQFLTLINFTYQISPQSQQLISKLNNNDIKICCLVNNITQINNIKKLLMIEQNVQLISCQKNSIQQIRYYLNYIVRNIKSNSNYKFCIIINRIAIQTIQHNYDLMQHMLFVLYYSKSIIGYDLTTEMKKNLVLNLKKSYISEQTIIGVGCSYQDLEYLKQCDLSVSLYSNLPVDIKANSIASITKLINIIPNFLIIEDYLFQIIFYRLMTIITIILILEIVLISVNTTSFTLDPNVIFIIVIIGTIIDILYGIFIGRNHLINIQSTVSYNQKYVVNICLTFLEAIMHAIIIVSSILLVLPFVRLNRGRLLSLQALHMSFLVVIVLINNFRLLFHKSTTTVIMIIMTAINFGGISISIIITIYVRPQFITIARQFFILFMNYDSVIIIINCSIFAIAISFFLQKVLKSYLKDKLNTLKKLKTSHPSKYNYFKLILHLLKQTENIEPSINQLVNDNNDLNALKINKVMQIRNNESNRKFLYTNRKININKFFQTLILITISLATLLIIDLIIQKVYKLSLSILILCILFSIALLCFLYFSKILMNYYLIAQIFISFLGILLLVYGCIDINKQKQIFYCFLTVLLLQTNSIRFTILLILCLSLCIGGGICIALSNNSKLIIITQIIQTIIFVAANLFIVNQFNLQVKIKFIINESFQKQTNHINDILSILVPKFVKKHLEQNFESSALQKEQNKVSILFCYVCNFDQIVKEEGKNVVLLMDQLWRQFDQLCYNYAVQKIQTVGMTYMCATGIKAYEDQFQNQMKKKNQVERLLKMSIKMLQKAKGITWGNKKNKRINIKIGIHHGNVMIGVIGYHKPQFSLIGDAVNTTSRHCSTGQPNDIILSEIAFKFVKRFSISSFMRLGKTMKGLGEVNVYKYRNSNEQESNQLMIRIKFRNIVNKVIEQLKMNGKIKHKTFKASEIATNIIFKQHIRCKTKKSTNLIENQRKKKTTINVIEDHLKQLDLYQNGQKLDNQSLWNSKFTYLFWQSQEYKRYLLSKLSKMDRILLLVVFAIYLIKISIFMLMELFTPTTIALHSIAFILYFIMLYFYKKGLTNLIFTWMFVIFCIYWIVLIKFYSILIPNIQNYNQNLIITNFRYYFQMVSLSIWSFCSVFRFLQILVISVIIILINSINCILKNQFQIELIFQLFYICFILMRKYYVMSENYQYYEQMIIHKKRSQEQSALVSQLLPKHAYQKLKNQNIEDKMELTDKFENCTILFADIKGFTSFSNRSTPAEVVKMLRQLFQEFDKNCLIHNVYKVYTIGDCYVVLGFTNCYQRNIIQEAKNVVNMALSMIQTITKVRDRINIPQLDMRIGIHTGQIIGGIIGTEIVRYDIYGSDVMIANKFEENGRIGNIYISQCTKNILENDVKLIYNMIPEGKVRIQKLNAQYKGYILTRKKFQV